MLRAFASNAQGQTAGAVGQSIPGAPGTIELHGCQETAVDAEQIALKSAVKYPAATRSNHRRQNRKAGLGGVGARAAEEMLGSSNACFAVKGRDLKRAAQRYVCLYEGRELAKVKMALAVFIGKGRVYMGASVMRSELTCAHVFDEVLAFPASVRLQNRTFLL